MHSEDEACGGKLLQVHAYDWVVRDKYSDDDKTMIHCWALDKNSDPYLLRIPNFPIFCQIELPLLVKNRVYTWTKSQADNFMTCLNKILGEQASTRYTFTHAKKTYYYRGNRRFPMINICFDNLAAMQKCSNILSNPLKTERWGFIKCEVWEDKITTVRKLLTVRNIKYSQWFQAIGYKVEPELRISTLENEYMVEWDTAEAISEDVCKEWLTKPRVLAFDIECYSNNHRAMPSKYEAPHVAYMISCIYQRYGEPDSRRRYGIILGDCNNIPKDKLDHCEIYKVTSEYSLVEAFGDVILKTDPEIITGYNIFSFDYPYLDHRVKRRLNTWPVMGRIAGEKSYMTSKNWKSGAYGYQSINILNMEGRISIDLLPIVKRDHKLEKYDLNTVCKKFLGANKGKMDVSAPEMFRIYENLTNSTNKLEELKSEIIVNPNLKDEPEYFSRLEQAELDYLLAKEETTKVMEYCIRDSELVIELMEQLGVWIGLIELSNIVGTTMVELFTRGQQVRCLSQLYDLAARSGYVLDGRDVPGFKFGGGFVFEPIPNIYENVICLDFASLYPSIIQAFNICYTTLVPKELEDLVPDEDCVTIEFDQEETDEYEEEDEDEFLTEIGQKKKKKVKVTRHYKFKWYQKQEGLLPKLVRQLVAERNAVRKEMETVKNPVLKSILNARQLALKVSANSFFGFLGVQNGGKMPLIEAAMTITAKGRELIGTVQKYLETTYGGKMVYGDTDSVRGHTPVMVRNKQGSTKIIQIEELCNNIQDSTDKQFFDIRNKNLEVWTEKGWTFINKLMRHKTDKKIFRIVTQTGVVDVTEDHSLLDENGKEVKPTEVRVGTKLLHKAVTNIQTDTDITEENSFALGFLMRKSLFGNEVHNKNIFTVAHTNRQFLKQCQTLMESIMPLGYFFIEPIFPKGYKLTGMLTYNNCLKSGLEQHNKSFFSMSNAGTIYKKVPDDILISHNNIKEAFIKGVFYCSDIKNRPAFNVSVVGQVAASGLYYLGSNIGYNVTMNIAEKRFDEIYTLKFSTHENVARNDCILKIIQLKNNGEYVYDFETENHHFAAGVGNLIVHNSCMIDLNIKDRKECQYWGERLSQEISGVKAGDPKPGALKNPLTDEYDACDLHQENVPGLFPPPLRMEFEKAMRLLCLKKKKYAALLVDKKGNFKKIPIRDNSGKITGYTDKYDILKKGIVLARRDNCKFLRDTYTTILEMILDRKPFNEAVTFLVTAIQKLLDGNVAYEDLVIIRELGANYKSDSYFMKVFSDNLKKAGKIVNPGDRLDFLICEDSEAVLLGQKMRLTDQYRESLSTDTPLKIDFMYYLEKVLMNPLDQLISIGFKPVIDQLQYISYKPSNRNKPIHLNNIVKMIIKMKEKGHHDITKFADAVNYNYFKLIGKNPIILKVNTKANSSTYSNTSSPQQPDKTNTSQSETTSFNQNQNTTNTSPPIQNNLQNKTNTSQPIQNNIQNKPIIKLNIMTPKQKLEINTCNNVQIPSQPLSLAKTQTISPPKIPISLKLQSKLPQTSPKITPILPKFATTN